MNVEATVDLVKEHWPAIATGPSKWPKRWGERFRQELRRLNLTDEQVEYSLDQLAFDHPYKTIRPKVIIDHLHQRQAVRVERVEDKSEEARRREADEEYQQARARVLEVKERSPELYESTRAEVIAYLDTVPFMYDLGQGCWGALLIYETDRRLAQSWGEQQ